MNTGSVSVYNTRYLSSQSKVTLNLPLSRYLAPFAVQNQRKVPKPEKVFRSDTATFHDYSQSMTSHEKRALYYKSVAVLFPDDGFIPICS